MNSACCQALTHHCSFGRPTNERLEFLGDAVLDCLMPIRCLAASANPARGRAVAGARLAGAPGRCPPRARARARRLPAPGRGRTQVGGGRRPSILADALEALFAAVYLDAGFEAASRVIDRLYAPLIAEVDPCRRRARTPRPRCRNGCRRAAFRCRATPWSRSSARPTRRSSRSPAKSPNSRYARWAAARAGASPNNSQPSSRSPR